MHMKKKKQIGDSYQYPRIPKEELPSEAKGGTYFLKNGKRRGRIVLLPVIYEGVTLGSGWVPQKETFFGFESISGTAENETAAGNFLLNYVDAVDERRSKGIWSE
mgnify:CR=1 FL=1